MKNKKYLEVSSLQELSIQFVSQTLLLLPIVGVNSTLEAAMFLVRNQFLNEKNEREKNYKMRFS